jgi:hypothetical protein
MHVAETGGLSGTTGISSIGNDDKPHKESHGEEPEENIAEASGTKADGGNMDTSAAAGADVEADRESFQVLCQSYHN